MKKIVLYCWAIIIYLASSTGLWLKTSKSVVEHTKDPAYDRVVLPCLGGSGHYSYDYSYLPKGFIGENDVLFFTSGYFKKERRVEIQVKIVDTQTQEKLRRVVILQQHEGKFEVFGRKVVRNRIKKKNQRESSSSLRSSNNNGESSSSNTDDSSESDSKHYLGYKRRNEKDSSDSSDSNHYYGYYDSSSVKKGDETQTSSKDTKKRRRESQSSSSSDDGKKRKRIEKGSSSDSSNDSDSSSKSSDSSSKSSKGQNSSKSSKSSKGSDSSSSKGRKIKNNRKQKGNKIKIGSRLILPSESHLQVFIEAADIRELNNIFQFVIRQKGTSCRSKANFLTGFTRKIERYIGYLPTVISKYSSQIVTLTTEKKNFFYATRLKSQLQELKSRYTKLKLVHYEFQRKCDIEYFQCHEVQVKETIIEEEFSVVKISQSGFSRYLKEEYQKSYKRSIQRSESYVEVREINFYGQEWSQRYSYNYNYESYEEYESLQCNDYQTVYEGSITKIHGNRIYARDSNSYDYELELGKCSRLEVATGRKFPQIGDRIYFKGGAKKGRKVRLHKGICLS